MHGIGRLFKAAGRHGPALLFGAVLAGLAVPDLAAVARPWMGFAVFLFTLGAFLKAEPGTVGRELRRPAVLAAVLLWSTFGVPLAVVGFVALVGPPPSAAVALILYSIAPPVGAAAAIAAMLGLSVPLALVTSVPAIAAAPLYVPLLATVTTGTALPIDPWTLSARLALIVGGAMGAALLLRRFAGRALADDGGASSTGLSVCGLLIIGLGAMHGAQARVLGDPALALVLLGLAFAVNVGLDAAGTAAGLCLGRLRAATLGMVSGNRNVTLVWAGLAPVLVDHPDIEFALATTVLPVFLLPALRQRIGRVAAGFGRVRSATAAVPLVVLAAGVTLASGAAVARPACDRALVLVVDASHSIDAEEWAMQGAGTVAALRAPEFTGAIGDGGIGRVAVTMVAFAERAATLVPWRIVGTAAEADAFAAAVEDAGRPDLGTVTLISQGLAEAADRFADLPCAAERLVVDVSGDGPDASFDVETGDDGLRAPLARLAAMGATVNALAIDLTEPGVLPATGFRVPRTAHTLAEHFRLEIARPTGGFVVVVRSPEAYGAVLLSKILRELS
ncbi:MAG: DUF1194 domain-containing protein [Rhodospirillales bacterium]